MKRCPHCNRVENDDTLVFCRSDGTALISDSGTAGTEAGTVKLTSAPVSSERETSVLPHTSMTPEINRPSGPTTPEFSAPKALFRTRMLAWTSNFHEFDVSPDGQRFLIGTLSGEPTAPPPTVILNWTAAMKK